MNNVISLDTKLKINKAKHECKEYEAKIKAMNNEQLLQEMIKFQEDWALMDIPALEAILKGMIFFSKLKESVDTKELKDMVEFYYSLLEQELKEYERQHRISS